MMYVSRDELGKVSGLYLCPQPQPDGTCLTKPEPLPDDHPEVVEYLNAQMKSQKRLTDGELAALLVREKVITQKVIDDVLAGVQPST